MAKLNKSFYNNETEYSDGSIEDEILEIVKNHENFSEILGKNEKWAVFYHLSPLRENILNWYPFKSESNLLEIGAECGALSGLFCERVFKVTAVELTDKRSQIIYERHKNKDNLEIMVGNLNNMEFPEKFDYIILNGVLEYAKMFTDTDEPYKNFLLKIKSMLSENGIILIAIENRLGLKYINGFKEDHLGQYFAGINQYVESNNIRTFSKKELEELVNVAGFQNYKFFYPYPDYKFPEIILTDNSVEKIPYNNPLPNYDQIRAKFFDENNLNLTLVNEGISKYFSNSFLLELRNTENIQESDDIWLIKISSARAECFRIFTIIKYIDSKLTVIKTPLSLEAKDHILKMSKFPEKYNYGNIKSLENTLDENNNLIFPFLYNKTMYDILINLFKNKRVYDFFKLINNFSNELKSHAVIYGSYHGKKFERIFGDEKMKNINLCLEYPNIDLIFENIFINNEKYTIIDYEWCFDFPIPVEFILWRAIFYLYHKTPLLNNFLHIDRIFKCLSISSTKIKIFKKWDYKFMQYVEGKNKSNQIQYKPIILLNNENITKIEQICNQINKNIMNYGTIEFYKELNKEINLLNKTIADKNKIIEYYSNSLSWKITKPLRWVRMLIKKIK
jgi:2-polyprenyl-3-methyl-5-hydroxy-6-metoxy-1,4-benzoquinol methylase